MNLVKTKPADLGYRRTRGREHWRGCMTEKKDRGREQMQENETEQLVKNEGEKKEKIQTKNLVAKCSCSGWR